MVSLETMVFRNTRNIVSALMSLEVMSTEAQAICILFYKGLCVSPQLRIKTTLGGFAILNFSQKEVNIVFFKVNIQFI